MNLDHSYWTTDYGIVATTHCKYEYSDTEISWIQSLIVIFWMMIGAPISKQIIPKIGYRWTLWIGGFLMMIGAVLSSMVTSIYYLYGTMGVIFGMGVGLCYLPHLLVAGEYFNEQRNNAFAIISSGILNERYLRTQGSSLKWTVLGQSGRSMTIELDGPND